MFRFPSEGEPSLAFVLEHAEVVDVDWRSDGGVLVTCAKNGTTKVREEGGHCKASLNAPVSGLCARACRFLTDATVLVAYYGPRGPSLLAKFKLAAGGGAGGAPEVANIPGRAAISSLALSPDKKTALLGYATGTHELWNLEKLKLVKKSNADEHEMPITAVALFGQGGLTGSADFTIRLLKSGGGSGGGGWCGFLGKMVAATAVAVCAYLASNLSSNTSLLH